MCSFFPSLALFCLFFLPFVLNIHLRQVQDCSSKTDKRKKKEKNFRSCFSFGTKTGDREKKNFSVFINLHKSPNPSSQNRVVPFHSERKRKRKVRRKELITIIIKSTQQHGQNLSAVFERMRARGFCVVRLFCFIFVFVRFDFHWITRRNRHGMEGQRFWRN